MSARAARTGVARIIDLAEIAGDRWRGDTDESKKAAQRKDTVHGHARHPPKLGTDRGMIAKISR
jgi:hypothetical protein